MKAVFLGRFQPLHNGHHQAIQSALAEYDGLEIVIGSADKSETEKNPLTSKEREDIIKQCFPEIEVHRLDDCESDKAWAENLAALEPEVVLTGNPNVQDILEEFSSLEFKRPEMFHPDIYSGSEVRRRIKSDEEWRYLVPECAKEKIEQYKEKIKRSGIQYSFEPGWKRENSKHGKVKK